MLANYSPFTPVAAHPVYYIDSSATIAGNTIIVPAGGPTISARSANPLVPASAGEGNPQTQTAVNRDPTARDPEEPE